jgi:hypothetical protein
MRYELTSNRHQWNGAAWGKQQLRFGVALDLFNRGTGSQLDQQQTVRSDIQDGQVGDDP